MAGKKTEPEHGPKLMHAPDELPGTLVAVYELRRYRYLLEDGTTCDVLAARDDSDLRAAIVAHTGHSITGGVAELPAVLPEREPDQLALVGD